MNKPGSIAIIVIIGSIIAFTAGMFLVFRPSKINLLLNKNPVQSTQTVQNNEPLKNSGNRITGSSKLVVKDGNEENNAPYIPDTTVGKTIGSTGGVIKTTLKNGVPVYLVIPPGSEVSAAEISEYSQLPTSPTHVPLYTDLGYGINVALEGVRYSTKNPVYLIFDFSKGSILSEFSGYTDKNNRCDFSRTSFTAEVCAAILNIPAGKTMGNKYTAVSPFYAASGKTPTVPLYSYYLGNDNLLVIGLSKSAVVIPQPLTKELAADIVNSTFQKYSLEEEKYEGLDFIRHFSLNVTDPTMIEDIAKTLTLEEFKTLFAYPMAQKIVIANKAAAETSWLNAKKDTFVSETLKNFSTHAVDESRTSLIAYANLYRAYKSKVKGSGKLTASVLNNFKNQLKNKEYSETTMPEFMEGAYLLMGRTVYKKQSAYLLNRHLNVLGDEDDATIGNDDNGTIIEDNPSWTGDADAYDQAVQDAIDQANQQAAKQVADTMNDPEATMEDMATAAGLAQMIGDESSANSLIDRMQKKALDDLDNADTADDFIRAAQRCVALGAGSDSRCGMDRVKKILAMRCKAKTGDKNLKNFGDQTMDRLDCDEITGN